jgi:hypothetical protein
MKKITEYTMTSVVKIHFFIDQQNMLVPLLMVDPQKRCLYTLRDNNIQYIYIYIILCSIYHSIYSQYLIESKNVFISNVLDIIYLI